MLKRAFGMYCGRAVVFGAVCCLASGRLRAQSAATLEMPTHVVEQIAADVQAGRSFVYCYHGFLSGATVPSVHVDSVTTVSAPEQCQGIGVGIVTRTSDRAALTGALGGLLRSHARWHVVSAFYGTELVQWQGRVIRAARAVSVLRGVMLNVNSRS